MTSKEFYKQLEIVAEERGLSLEQLLDSFKKGLINAYKRSYGNTSVRVEFKPEKNEILMFKQRIVVESLENLDPECEIVPILYTEAKKINARAKIDDILEEPVNIKDFGRMAASQAKQIFNQNIKSYEKENSFQYFKSMENEMISAQVVDANENFLTLSIGNNITTLLPRKELLPSDDFNVGDRITVYVTSVEQGTKGPKVFVSRNDKHLVIRLLEQQVPEIKEGIVEIKGIARDAGDRCKISVYSTDPNVDPIGACVGENSYRIREVVRLLNGEKIDLYRYSENVAELIANALQPTNVVAVINIDQKTKTSLAIVPDNQLSLAIGKNGQNVRLAVQSCDWKIDIKPVSVARNQGYEW